MQEKMLFSWKFTQLAQILHDRRSWRSRQISTLARKGDGSIISSLNRHNLCCILVKLLNYQTIKPLSWSWFFIIIIIIIIPIIITIPKKGWLALSSDCPTPILAPSPSCMCSMFDGPSHCQGGICSKFSEFFILFLLERLNSITGFHTKGWRHGLVYGVYSIYQTTS